MTPSPSGCRRVLVAALPFFLIAAVFVSAAAWHLGAPARRAADVRTRLAAPSASGETPVAEGDYLSLSRAPCRGGSCPAFGLLLHADGHFEFVRSPGACPSRTVALAVDAAVARGLMAAVADAGFAGWPEPGRRDGADVGVATVGLHVAGLDRRVSFTEGGRDDPPEFAAVAQALESSLGLARWLPGADGRCPAS